MNNVLQDGAWIATILGGGSVVAAVVVWIRNQFRRRRELQSARRHRDWHGYIHVGMLSSWHVRVADAPETPTGRIVLAVLDGPDGAPDVNRAHSMRVQVARDGMLARVPSPEQYEFLASLHRNRGNGNDPQGFPVH
ncbi:hypothetical protein ACFXPA_24410 [Amycolatopsis sp. NPDC059090]|uniref:hypothetical protein n=1 Tax=unclassified Amycolatopsis TaxID=2618356 RepID=UPI00366FDED8